MATADPRAKWRWTPGIGIRAQARVAQCLPGDPNETREPCWPSPPPVTSPETANQARNTARHSRPNRPTGGGVVEVRSHERDAAASGGVSLCSAPDVAVGRGTSAACWWCGHWCAVFGVADPSIKPLRRFPVSCQPEGRGRIPAGNRERQVTNDRLGVDGDRQRQSTNPGPRTGADAILDEGLAEGTVPAVAAAITVLGNNRPTGHTHDDQPPQTPTQHRANEACGDSRIRPHREQRDSRNGTVQEAIPKVLRARRAAGGQLRVSRPHGLG